MGRIGGILRTEFGAEQELKTNGYKDFWYHQENPYIRLIMVEITYLFRVQIRQITITFQIFFKILKVDVGNQ